MLDVIHSLLVCVQLLNWMAAANPVTVSQQQFRVVIAVRQSNLKKQDQSVTLYWNLRQGFCLSSDSKSFSHVTDLDCVFLCSWVFTRKDGFFLLLMHKQNIIHKTAISRRNCKALPVIILQKQLLKMCMNYKENLNCEI